MLLQDLQRIRQEEKFNAQKKMQTVYFASVAHDFRTPLNAMLSATQSLKVSNLPEQFNEIVTMLEISTRFLLNLVEDILVRLFCKVTNIGSFKT